MSKLLSERVKKIPSNQVSAERYAFLKLSEAEPDLGVPTSNGHVLSSSTTGTRSWVNLDLQYLRKDTSDSISGTLTVQGLNIDGVAYTDIATATTTATTQTTLISFLAASYGCGEFLIQATQGTARHITKILVAHDGTTAIATEYGVLLTNSGLYSVDVDINSGNVRVLITPTSATSTSFKAFYTLIGA